ncbi:hypothetical protein GCM10008014_09510 [Paenibacillus silvae]|uniref:Uncharacterized protein n=1 Tax=Paenibacillus silvae TaxID=1325358 RepID=A0ABQ1Z3V8_9BACL|nr:hypothetical protein GCM10008014_09510 [Paenibacillus silvae]
MVITINLGYVKASLSLALHDMQQDSWQTADRGSVCEEALVPLRSTINDDINDRMTAVQNQDFLVQNNDSIRRIEASESCAHAQGQRTLHLQYQSGTAAFYDLL